jgi:hypothetical protein
MLPPGTLIAFNPFDLQSWYIPLIGMAAMTFALFVGLAFFTRRRHLPRLTRGSATDSTEPASPDPFTHGSPSEKRKAYRRGGNPIEIQVTDANQETKPVPGWVINRSTGGIGVILCEPVEEGVILSIRAANAPAGTPWYQVEVKSCRQGERDWELGCQWVRVPPWSVLLLFG